jgi:hypothetical protein
MGLDLVLIPFKKINRSSTLPLCLVHLFADDLKVEAHFEFSLAQTLNAFAVVDDGHELDLLSFQGAFVLDCHFVVRVELKHVNLVLLVLVEGKGVTALFCELLHEVVLDPARQIWQFRVVAVVAR